MSKLEYIDLFSGCGGLRLGLALKKIYKIAKSKNTEKSLPYFPFSTTGFYNASLTEARLMESNLITAELRAASATQDKHVN